MSSSQVVGFVVSVLLALGTACGGPNPAVGTGGGQGGGSGGGGGVAGCAAGTQDVDGDGVCQPDCASTACMHGSCAVPESTGLAVCTCAAGFGGAACDAPAVPSSDKISFWVDAANGLSISRKPGTDLVLGLAEQGAQHLNGAPPAEANAPVLVPGVQNGLPVLRFDGVDDRLTYLGLQAFATPDYTLFLVLRTTPGSTGGVLEGRGGSADAVELRARNENVGYFHAPATQSNYVACERGTFAAGGWTTGAFHLVTVRASRGTVSMWVDGNQMMSEPTMTNDTLTETLTFALGGMNGGNDAFNGDLAELIVVADNLAHVERVPFEDYLAAKWFGAAFERTPSAFGVNPVWLDASKASSLATANGAVTGWENQGYAKGGFSNGTYADRRPALVTEAVNGHPAVRFDGNDVLVQNGISMKPGGEPSAYTILAVVTPPGPALTNMGQLLFGASKPGLAERTLQLHFAPNGDTGAVAFRHRWPMNASDTDSLSTSVSFAKPMLVRVLRTSAANYSLSAAGTTKNVNGSQATNIPAGETLDWTLGGESLLMPGGALKGDVAEFIVLNNQLDASAEAALVAQLKAKWGL